MKLKYLLNYLNERFPFVNMILFGIIYAMVNAVTYQLNIFVHHSIAYHLLAIGAVVSFFFRLRVFDEMKDYAIDTINHPNRILQSGKIDLKTLQIIAFLGFCVEILWISMAGTTCQIAWLIAFIYSVLMRYEFFVPKLLNKNLLIYAITHMLIMPFIIVWIWTSQVPSFTINYALILLLLLSMLSGFAFEIARKTHAPDAERPKVDSYSKLLGLKNAQYLILLLILGMTLSLFILFYLLQVTSVSYLIIFAAFVFTFFSYTKTIKSPTEDALRSNEKKVSIMMLISYLSLIILQFV